jgi:hypothetical protein
MMMGTEDMETENRLNESLLIDGLRKIIRILKNMTDQQDLQHGRTRHVSNENNFSEQDQTKVDLFWSLEKVSFLNEE